MSRKSMMILAGSAVVGGVAVALAVPALQKRALRVTTILKKDHRAVRRLFYALTHITNASARKEIFSQIRTQLEIHARAEEEIFYPAVRNLYTTIAQREVAEARHEHQEIKDLLHEISAIDPESYRFMSTCNQLQDVVERHVEEEENEMFVLAGRQMSGDELDRLGRRIQQRKTQLKENAAA